MPRYSHDDTTLRRINNAPDYHFHLIFEGISKPESRMAWTITIDGPLDKRPDNQLIKLALEELLANFDDCREL